MDYQMKTKKILHIKTVYWKVSDVYVIRENRGYPSKIILSLSTEWFDYRKKMSLSIEEVQDLFWFVLDLNNSKKWLIWSMIKINEIAKVIY